MKTVRALRKLFFLSLIGFTSAALAQTQAPPPKKAESDFLTTYPKMKDFLYKEPPSNVYLGIGASPITFIGSSLALGLSAFQMHYLTRRLDIELINAFFKYKSGYDMKYRSNHLVLRMAPKWRISPLLSMGLLLGYEVASFPNVQV